MTAAKGNDYGIADWEIHEYLNADNQISEIKRLVALQKQTYHMFLNIIAHHGGEVFVSDNVDTWRDNESKVEWTRDASRGGTVWSVRR